MLRSFAFILSALAAASSVQAQRAGFNPETGSYVFHVYSGRTYGAAAQNWGMVQDRRGVMYFANTDGLLEFDGVNWRMIRLPGRIPGVRSVALDGNGNVLVGGVGDFGMLQADSTGNTVFHSLLDRVQPSDREFGDVWRILVSPEGVWFSSYARLFRWNPDRSITALRPATKFGRAFLALGSVYVKNPVQGLTKLQGATFVPVPGGEEFATADVTSAIPGPDDATIATAAHLYRLTPSGVTRLHTQSDEFFETNSINSMLKLGEGSALIGTRRGGMAFLDLTAGARIERIVSKAQGLPDDYVTALYSDRQGGIWVTGYNGIGRLNRGLSTFGPENSLQGETLTMARHEGTLYVGSTSGVFRLMGAEGRPPVLSRVDGNNDSVWSFLSAGKFLLAGTDHGVFEVSGDAAHRVLETSGPVWDLAPSHTEPGVVYAAGRNGVFRLRQIGNTWQKDGVVASTSQEFRSVLEDPDGTVWAALRGGVWHINFHADPPRVEKLGAAEGVPANWINVRPLSGHVVFTTEKGLRRYSPRDRRFVPDVSLGATYADGSHATGNVFGDAKRGVWITGPGYHARMRSEPAGSQWDPMPLLGAKIQEIAWMFIDSDGVCWAISDEKKLFRWDSALNGQPDAGFQVLTRRLQGSKANYYGGEGTPTLPQLPYADNALHFEFAAPFYEDPSTIQYQVKLEGNDRDWTLWNGRTDKDYTHLPEGSYRFRVRARTPHGTVVEDSRVAFGIYPPWFRTWWAYSIYVLCVGAGVWGIVRLRTRQLKEEKRQLEQIVEERTVEIREQRDEIQVQERKSKALLLNILPAPVADELKATGAVQPVGFDEVTVCFTDFVGFTLSSEKLSPDKLVASLNEYFTAFDEIIARYGLEKLKTIGDSYMFASGLPTPRSSHAVDATLAALEMVNVVKELARKTGGAAWGIRVGLHSGPVVAGVVGIRKFAFDIWGNTVNFAARMESSGVPGHVNMSDKTRQLLRELIATESRGNVRTKEGREVPMFLALGPVGADQAEFSEKYVREFGIEPQSFPATDCRAAMASLQTL